MQLTFSTTVCPDLLLPDALRVAREAGFRRIELFRAWTESSPVHADTSVRMVRERLDDAGIALAGLNIRNLTGCNANGERDLRYNLRQVEWDIHLACALRLRCANLKGGQRTDEAREDFVAGIKYALDRISDFTLNLGNHKGNLLENIADYERVLPELPNRAKVLMDTGHLLSAGVDVRDFAMAFADRIGAVHLRDQKGETPVPFGEGDLPFEDVIGILKGAGYDGDLVVELENVTWAEPAEACAVAREYVENILS